MLPFRRSVRRACVGQPRPITTAIRPRAFSMVRHSRLKQRRTRLCNGSASGPRPTVAVPDKTMPILSLSRTTCLRRPNGLPRAQQSSERVARQMSQRPLSTLWESEFSSQTSFTQKILRKTSFVIQEVIDQILDDVEKFKKEHTDWSRSLQLHKPSGKIACGGLESPQFVPLRSRGQAAREDSCEICDEIGLIQVTG